MESEEHVHVIHVWKQAVSRGKSLDTRHIREQLAIHETETIGVKQSCLAVKERITSQGRKDVDISLSNQLCCSKARVIS